MDFVAIFLFTANGSAEGWDLRYGFLQPFSQRCERCGLGPGGSRLKVDAENEAGIDAWHYLVQGT